MVPPLILDGPVPHGEHILNWQQVCQRLGCSKSEFYRKVQRGDFAVAYRLHAVKGVVVPQWAVDEFLESRRID